MLPIAKRHVRLIYLILQQLFIPPVRRIGFAMNQYIAYTGSIIVTPTAFYLPP